MKVLCLIDSIGAGGAQRQLVGLAAMLKDKGYDVLVVYYHNDHFFSSFLNTKGVSHRYVEGADNIWKKLRGVLQIVDSFVPDTIISYLGGANMLACLMRLLGRKFNLIVSERSLTQRLSLKTRIKFVLYSYSDYIVPNSYTESIFICNNFPFLKKKVVTITNYVDIERFTTHCKTEKEDNNLRLLCVGSIRKVKNTLRLISAVKLVIDSGNNIHVCWFGAPLEKEYYEKCLLKIRELGMQDIFCFYPPIVDIQNEYLKADLFCLPSLYEGFPNVLCEAMTCGLPVIAGKVSDNAYILGKNNGVFLFNPYSVEEIAKCIVRFQNLPLEERIQVGQKNRKNALKKFSKEYFVEQYMKLI